MKAVTRITFFDDHGEKFFGEGPARLLHGVEETGSLRSAAMTMGMAYTKALRILRNAEEALGFPLTTRVVGGRCGGGSRLTPEGKAWLNRYEAYRDACLQASRELYLRHFPEEVFGNTGCVIMASGLGKRFGGNKLMADFLGEPLICRAFAATDGIFVRRVVVTRHGDVAALCRERGMEVVLHELPHRSDTVRLGLEALGGVERCMFCPGDQPLLRRVTVANLVRAAVEAPERIWRAAWDDTPGAPVLFPKWAFPELLALPEGKGGGFVVSRHPDRLSTLSVEDRHELMDADTPEEMAYLAAYTKTRGESHDQTDK